MAHAHKKQTLINQPGYGCVYCITNKITGEKYIGQTRQEYISKRWSEHKIEARTHHSNMIIYDAMRMYGMENFVFEVLETNIPVAELWDKEIFYINKLNTFSPNGYNSTKGGGGTLGLEPWDKGKNRSEEVKKKISDSYTSERRKKASERVSGANNPMYGKCGKLNPMYGKKRSGKDNYFYGKHHTDEVKQFLSNVQQFKKKRVAMINKDTNEKIMEFESLSIASKYLVSIGFTKADDSAIGKCAKGNYKTAYGYKWEFIEE